MNSVSILFILVGVFILFNANNIVGVFKGEKQFNFQGK